MQTAIDVPEQAAVDEPSVVRALPPIRRGWLLGRSGGAIGAERVKRSRVSTGPLNAEEVAMADAARVEAVSRAASAAHGAACTGNSPAPHVTAPVAAEPPAGQSGRESEALHRRSAVVKELT